MTGETALWIVSGLLLLGNMLFVAVEYALINARRSRVEALAKRGQAAAKAAAQAIAQLPTYVAGSQVGITMVGIGMGAVTEPLLTSRVRALFDVLEPWGLDIPVGVSKVVSVVFVTFVVVVVAELVPKYVSLAHPEGTAMRLSFFARAMVALLKPLVLLTQRTAGLILRLVFRIDMRRTEGMAISKEELQLLIKAGTGEGLLQEQHASVISKALRLDDLTADDIMIHRLDIRWMDLKTPREEIAKTLGALGHSRVPVCRGDLDDMVGILYVQDFLKHGDDPDFRLEKILRPVVAIPENLTLNRIIQRMRESKSQIVIVMDEYGGTSGLLTLEDISEEVFGDLEDQLEGERPAIERMSARRISARSDVRYDELFEFLGLEDPDEEYRTHTLAEILVERLRRVPKVGDVVELPIGKLRVENMARRRITRVGIELADAP